jgi:hypothetical protein
LRLYQQGGNAAVESDYLYHGNESIPMLPAMFVGDRSGTDLDVNPFYRNPEEIEKICSQLILVGGADKIQRIGLRFAKRLA